MLLNSIRIEIIMHTENENDAIEVIKLNRILCTNQSFKDDSFTQGCNAEADVEKQRQTYFIML